MATIYILAVLIGTVIVAGITISIFYVNQMFNDMFKLVEDIKVDIKDAHIEIKKLKEDSED